MHIFKNQKLQLITLAILVIGLGVGVYLVQTKQIFKPKASTNLYSAFDVTDQNGNPIDCDQSGNCNTNSLNVKFRLENIEALTEP
ncbi:hypothetical protein A3F00_00055 [Candidatus Daviesbacteria bacterium RIFCSPHIGHO2_12_FULL_37_11]|uniref:Uncharacterized protein n=1 Tax=Candidatus Daviesbacteria bacterium RIFCSPHIGHO2_12_FULL_37_11 TaxID=1797777 RepID=A0A1F5KC95_9BACT|nr:MAG: hypothetical protein A2769_01495 [Candidatus Daviesbacteria bacterium RIFCSPHIGHO2_01_FULL_37_27]OGE38395.1 MAG: hypothetical protein A3F00_00055 [Candidatus Daviesbacteria bacterium RIFCSPHIGHO2_12_FULL_37_11]